MPDTTKLDRIEGRLAKMEARLGRVEQRLTAVHALQRATLSEIFTMTPTMESVLAKVTELETTNDSAIELLGQLAQMIRDGAADQSAMLALADRIDADKSKMANAIVSNTPGGPVT